MTMKLRQATLEVAGMTCESCVPHVADALHTAGARAVDVDWRAGLAHFAWPQGVGEAQLRAELRNAGYEPGALRTTDVPGVAGADGFRTTSAVEAAAVEVNEKGKAKKTKGKKDGGKKGKAKKAKAKKGAGKRGKARKAR